MATATDTGPTAVVRDVGGAAHGGGEAYAATHLKRNYFLMLLDAIAFPFGMSFISVTTILPLFVRELTSSALAVGAISAVYTLGMLLPPLFVAHRVERRPIQKWWLFWIAIVERAPLLVLAALTPWLGRSNPDLLLTLFFICLTVHSVAMGTNMPCYFNLFAKVIPANRRGGMWGIGGAISGLLALGGAQLTGVLLDRYGFPDAYALSFLFCFVVLTVGILGFPFVRELPHTETPPRVGVLEYLRRAPSLLRMDREFGGFVLSQVLSSVAFMAPAFYTVYALDRFGAGPRDVVLFTMVLMGSQTVANLGLGLLADRRGNKLVLQMATLLGAAASLLAVLGPALGLPLGVMYAVFALNGFFLAGSSLGGFNMPLEFASAQQVPTYSAISMTAVAPVRALAPLLGGLLAAGGYEPVFVLSTVASIAGLALLSRSVPDPRLRQPAPSAVAP